MVLGFSASLGVISHKSIAIVATVLLGIFGFIGHGPATYRYAILFLGPLLWGVYFARERLHLHACAFAVFAAALVLHDLGAFGTYGKFYYGLEFDTYVHFVFGLAGAFVVSGALRGCFGLRGWQLWAGTILVIMGIGALHELMEFASTMALGDKGMLKLNDPDKFDTQKDLGNNLLGCLTALFIYSTLQLVWRKRTEPNVTSSSSSSDSADA
jgi:uncharacterized membrane protein YjdF